MDTSVSEATKQQAEKQIVQYLQTVPTASSVTIARTLGLRHRVVRDAIVRLVAARQVGCTDGEEPLVNFWIKKARRSNEHEN